MTVCQILLELRLLICGDETVEESSREDGDAEYNRREDDAEDRDLLLVRRT